MAKKLRGLAWYEERQENMSHFERFVTEDTEKADECAKAGAMLDEGFMVDAKAETMKIWKRKQVHEDVRKRYRTKIPDKKLGKMEKTTFGTP